MAMSSGPLRYAISATGGAVSYSRTSTAAEASFTPATITLPFTSRPTKIMVTSSVAGFFRFSPDATSRTIDVPLNPNSLTPTEIDISAAVKTDTGTLTIATELLAVGTVLVTVIYGSSTGGRA